MEDNIREWTALKFVNSQRALENRETLKKLVAKSSVEPQRPSRLNRRDIGEIFSLLSILFEATRQTAEKEVISVTRRTSQEKSADYELQLTRVERSS